MVDEFIIRIGTFFILIGVGIFILFVASDYANQTNFDYLFWAVLSVTVGILFRRRKPAAASQWTLFLFSQNAGRPEGS